MSGDLDDLRTTTVAGSEQTSAKAFMCDGDQQVLAEGEYSLPESEDRPSCVSGSWRVVVGVRDRLVTRSVCYYGQPWSSVRDSNSSDGQHPDEVIWPTWPATLAEEKATESPLEDLQRNWDTTINRLRDSAKWMAAVLGAALASLIPTAQLSGLSQRHISAAALVLGIGGLLFVSITLLLVLQVMRPRSVSYTGVQDAQLPTGMQGKLRDLVRKGWKDSHALESPLYGWKHTVGAHPDLYLPCGIYSLVTLRQAMTVEEMTLVALSRASERASNDTARENLSHAQAARIARLYELRTAAAKIVAVGMYYCAHARSTRATYGGVAFGFFGIVAIITAIAWPIT